jgi:hypothetical protein
MAIQQAYHNGVRSRPDEMSNESTNQQIALPVSMGGLGLRKATVYGKVAYMCNKAKAAKEILKQRKKWKLNELIDSDKQLLDISKQLIDLGVHSSNIFPEFGENAENKSLLHFYAEHEQAALKLQKKLTRQIDVINRMILIQNARNRNLPHMVARLCTLSAYSSCHLPVHAVPFNAQHAMTDDEYRIYIRNRNGQDFAADAPAMRHSPPPTPSADSREQLPAGKILCCLGVATQPMPAKTATRNRPATTAVLRLD